MSWLTRLPSCCRATCVFCPFQCHIDVRADVFLANEFVESILGKDTSHIVVHAREDDSDAFLLRHRDEVLEVVHACGVDEGYTAHADDAHGGTFFHGRHDFLKLVGNAEEVGTIDFIHLHMLGNGQVLNVRVGGKVGLCCGVNLVVVGEHTDLRGLGHASHAEQAGKHQADLDGDGQVENHGEDECEPQHEGVALGVVHHLTDGAPTAHVVTDHDEHTCQACHGDVFGVWHEEEVNQQQHNRMDDARDGCLAAVVDVGHGASDGTCGGDASEDGAQHVGNALTDEFLVGVVLVSDDTIGHSGRKQALDGT